jgi:hypothetical protein
MQQDGKKEPRKVMKTMLTSLVGGHSMIGIGTQAMRRDRPEHLQQPGISRRATSRKRPNRTGPSVPEHAATVKPAEMRRTADRRRW